jgi:hypothetical protein
MRSVFWKTRACEVAEQPQIVPSTPVISSKKGGSAARRPSTSVPAIRRDESNSRPKREIHAPPPRDLTYSDAPRRTRKPRASKNEKSSEQLRFCSRLLADLNKKPHENYAYPFYTPVGVCLSRYAIGS